MLKTIIATTMLAACAFGQQTINPHTEFKVKLLAPLSTDTNKKGDKVTAQVVAPAQYAGATMEGEVKESKSGGKVKGTSVLTLGFSALFPKQGNKIDVSADVKSFVNSKGKAGVDEEGRVVEKKNQLGKVAVATGAGALIGAIAGGGKGAAIGAGVGAGASLIFVQMATKGPNVTFAPGSELILDVSERR